MKSRPLSHQSLHFRCLRTGTVHDLPTSFDPELITKLDPEPSDYLKRRGFQVMGYHLELLGYHGQDSEPETPFAPGSPITQTTTNSTRTAPETSGAAES
jgi:hypothetical protein